MGIFAAAGAGAVSDLTRAEVLVIPYRNGDAVLEASFHAFFAITEIAVEVVR